MSERRRGPPFRTRVANAQDAAAIAALWADTLPRGWSRRAVEALIADPRASVWMTRDDEALPIGFLAARGLPDSLEVLAVGVAAPQRGAGVGTALLEALLREARARGCRRVDLEVAERNAAALRLYQSRDFVAVGRRPRYYESGEDALLMTCELGDDH